MYEGQLLAQEYRVSKKSIFFLFVAVLFFSFWMFSGGDLTNKETKKIKSAVVSQKNNPYNRLFIEADAAIVWDILNKEALYKKNEEAQLPLASLTKVMTALLAQELLPKGYVVTIGGDAIAQEGDTGLFRGERWKVSELIDFTLISSSNDGATALASAVSGIQNIKKSNNSPPLPFFKLMNIRAKEIGMEQTFFVNESGLDINQEISGAYGSAQDLATLFEYILATSPEFFEGTRRASYNVVSYDSIVHNIKNTNEYVQSFPGIVASKTGFTDLAGGNLAVVFEIGPMHPIAIVVLGSTQEGRFKDVSRLLGATVEYFSQ